MTAQLATRLVSPPTQRRAADAHVAAIDRIAALMAADANTRGDAVTMARAVATCRALNQRLTAWLAKRGGRP